MFRFWTKAARAERAAARERYRNSAAYRALEAEYAADEEADFESMARNAGEW